MPTGDVASLIRRIVAMPSEPTRFSPNCTASKYLDLLQLYVNWKIMGAD